MSTREDILSLAETEARAECSRRGIDPDELCADGGITAWMVVDQERRHFAASPTPPAAKAPGQEPVAVKPLEWINCAALNGGRKLLAHDPFGNEVGRFDLRGMLESDPEVVAYKAEMQVRYERRIRSALVSAPTKQEPVAAVGKPRYWKRARKNGVQYATQQLHFNSREMGLRWVKEYHSAEIADAEAGWSDHAPAFKDNIWADLDTPPTYADAEAKVYRHKKRGTEYVLLGIGKMQAEHWRDGSIKRMREATRSNSPDQNASVDMREVAVYRSVDDGSIWVRPHEEFEDGRFEPTAIRSLASPAPKEGQ